MMHVDPERGVRPADMEVPVDSIWLWPLGLVALLVAWPALSPLVARLFSDRVRTPALTEQPDHIYLLRVAEPKWRHDDPRQLAETQLASAGFVEAGVFVVREMPELTLGLHAHVAERAYAILYDHPRSGFWSEFVTRYEDGSLATYTTLEPAEVDMPEGSVHVSEPQLSLTLLWKRMLAERPKKPMLECVRARAAQDFEKGYAESVAHHKRRTGEAARDGEPLRHAA
jgi:hypothetical protein